jgi:tetratricopeptide (TPR) repeat protein
VNRLCKTLLVLALGAAAAPAAFAAGAGFGSMLNGVHCSDMRRPADERIAACRHMVVSHLLNSEGNAMMLIDLGVAYSDKGDNDDALQAYTDSIAQRPIWLAYYNRAVLYTNQRQNAAALADLDAATALDAGKPEVFALRGQVHRILGHTALALADFDAALKLKPDDAAALRGRCEMQAGPGTGGSCAPSTQADRLAALNRKAVAAYRAGDDVGAVAIFTEVLVLAPKSPIALYLRGRAREHSGDKTGGAIDIQAAFILDHDVDHEAANFAP